MAKLYDRCGHSPGGRWFESVNAGLEDQKVVILNDSVARLLHMTMTGPVRRQTSLSVRKGGWLDDIAERLDLYRRFETLPGRRAGHMSPLDWDRFGSAVESFGPELREVAAATKLAKDPRFSWTLPIWLAAGAQIEHVIFTTRRVDAMLASRQHNRLHSFSSQSDAKNSIIYAIGVSMSACWDHEVEYTLLRFPDFLGDVDALHRLPLLRDLGQDDFEKIVGDLIRADLVHHS